MAIPLLSSWKLHLLGFHGVWLILATASAHGQYDVKLLAEDWAVGGLPMDVREKVGTVITDAVTAIHKGSPFTGLLMHGPVRVGAGYEMTVFIISHRSSLKGARVKRRALMIYFHLVEKYTKIGQLHADARPSFDGPDFPKGVAAFFKDVILVYRVVRHQPSPVSNLIPSHN